MERPKIRMLSRFDTISHIMPYYSHTHKAFLLLSSLCSPTRDKLDEFYDEFVTLMTKYRMNVKIISEYYLNYLFLPSDLFIINLKQATGRLFDAFIKFINKCEKSEGWHFNKHSMHSQIKFQDIIEIEFCTLIWRSRGSFKYYWNIHNLMTHPNKSS